MARGRPKSIKASIAARADVRLPAIFSDNMVLQQGAKVPVWGWAEEGEVVTVRFGEQIAKGKKYPTAVRALAFKWPRWTFLDLHFAFQVKDTTALQLDAFTGQSANEFPTAP